MLCYRRAERIRTIAVILTSALLLVASASAAPPKVAAGKAAITVTTQVIKQESHKKLQLQIIAFAIYNKNISRYAIGNGVIRCTRISQKRTLPKGTRICLAVYRMPLGQIIAGGLVTSNVFYRLAVAGGMGAYANVGSGQVQVVATKLKPRRERLIFVIYSF